MSVAEMVLRYLDVLVWPVLTGALAIAFRAQMKALLTALANRFHDLTSLKAGGVEALFAQRIELAQVELNEVGRTLVREFAVDPPEIRSEGRFNTDAVAGFLARKREGYVKFAERWENQPRALPFTNDYIDRAREALAEHVEQLAKLYDESSSMGSEEVLRRIARGPLGRTEWASVAASVAKADIMAAEAEAFNIHPNLTSDLISFVHQTGDAIDALVVLTERDMEARGANPSRE